jgi:hypothetical protein
MTDIKDLRFHILVFVSQTNRFSPINSAFYKKSSTVEWLDEFTENLILHIQNHKHLSKVFDDSDKKLLKAGLMTESHVELLAISEFNNWTIEYKEIDEEMKIIENIVFHGIQESSEKSVLMVFFKGKHFVNV